jgi:hypothetical protein
MSTPPHKNLNFTAQILLGIELPWTLFPQSVFFFGLILLINFIFLCMYKASKAQVVQRVSRKKETHCRTKIKCCANFLRSIFGQW